MGSHRRCLPLISSDELMIRDFAELDDGAAVAADICIAGGGAAGITLAREFIGTRFRVLMLEAVFPTSAHSNPASTILALCLRIADRLKSVLA
jgi:choline dehydrogenase-like flavoprotein